MIIRVPATTANLGPGFDTLGCALGWHAEFRLDDGGTGRAPVDQHHLALRAFRQAGGEGPLWATSSLPMGRGLGSSAALRVGGLVAAAVQRNGAAVDVRDPTHGVLAHATRLEGHADNAAAALHGGITITAEHQVVALPVPADLVVVVWIPPQVTRTAKARRSLPQAVPFADAVFNVARVAMLVGALATDRLDVLAMATADRLHQDLRLEAQTASREALDAARRAGALGAWLSGSGPSIACWCRRHQADQVRRALPASGRVEVLEIAPAGAEVIDG